MVFMASDNTANVSREIMEALASANHGHAKSYGNDDYSHQLTGRFRELFEHEALLVFPVFNGSAANCLGLASLLRPYESVITYSNSHIEQDECGMPEFFTGSKLLKVAGEAGKISPDAIVDMLVVAKNSGVHHTRPKAISITQSTEAGTVYTPQEISVISAIAKANGLYLHMDGARFANALVHLGCSPAEISWKAGVDVMAFGGTKNGAMLAEVVIFFNPELARDFNYIQKRSGQLASKQRYLAIQMLALLEKDLWLHNARHANRMAALLANELANIPECRPLLPVEANSVFVEMPKKLADELLAKGHYFYKWPLMGKDTYRLVTSFATTPEEVDEFVSDGKK